MNIGPYTFQEFKERAAAFHGYPAPGLLLGGYMVAMAQKKMPQGVLFEAIVETKKCLPDAVQLLTLCSIGNNWLKIINLGRYAVTLFDKFSGAGFRVYIDTKKLADFPETKAWLLKQKAKKDQDTEKLFKELELAGDTICGIQPVQISARFLGHAHMGKIGVCPSCAEPFPAEDGFLCRGCQGEAPYTLVQGVCCEETMRPAVVPVEEAVGKRALHDMTQIIPGKFKDPAFKAGQVLSAGDVCRLQQMGRFSVAVQVDDDQDINKPNAFGVHENIGAETFARRMAGANVGYALPPKEGKVNLHSTAKGLLCVNKKRLEAFNLVPDVMCASRQDGTAVSPETQIAGTRVIPLYIQPDVYARALNVLEEPLFSVAPFRKAKAGILVTGTEVFKGLIEDKFIPIITAKLQNYDCEIVCAEIVPDDKEHIGKSIAAMKEAGIDLLVTTGGLSVDPDDVTRAGLTSAGLTDVLYGAPVLPGTMSLVGRMLGLDGAREGVFAPNQAADIRQPENGEVQVVGVPACALYFKTTLFDILLARLLAGRVITRQELASMGEGGFCANCKVCTWPKCFFVK